MPNAATDASSVPLQAGSRADNQSGGLLLVAGFGAALFASAFLLFSVQPMVSRMVLPRLGGSPAVWNTCVCFFQAMLLLGYAYADVVALRLRPRAQLGLHGVTLMAGLALMPLSIGAAVPSSGASPAWWLLGRLALTIGLPFFAISATAPLLQHWFSRTSHRHARDPYFLYAASNAGSLLALLSTPLVIEPLLGLSQQTRLWSAGFAIVVLCVMACGLAALRRPGILPGGAGPHQAALHEASHSAPLRAPATARAQLRWVALAFVPSGLMLAVTTYITTDIAAAPLFWVIPLTIYILTFMLAFGRTHRGMPRYLPILQAIFLSGAAVAALMGVPSIPALAVALAVFTLSAAVCHFELANQRPEPGQLTRYFLLISVGGALGGIFNALVAPLLFPGPWEYPLLLIAACAVRPRGTNAVAAAPAKSVPTRPPLLRLAVILLVGVVLVYASGPWAPDWLRPYGRVAGVVLPVAGLILLARGGAYLGIGVASLLILPLIVRTTGAEQSVRSFFGTYRVMNVPAEDVTVLLHGTTAHGIQSNRPGEAALPLGYYYRGGSFGRLFAALRTRPEPLRNVGIVGLGIGALGCYAQPGERWVFREIDPAVERLARENQYFHVLKLCGNHPEVVLGDARITLAHETAPLYDLLVIDAFSSDSIPAHLLTREALALYFAHVAPGGVVVFHISNRYLKLGPLVARLAQDAGAPARHLLVRPAKPDLRETPAELIAIAKPGGNLDALAQDGWDVPSPGPVLWTDERSDIASLIRW